MTAYIYYNPIFGDIVLIYYDVIVESEVSTLKLWISFEKCIELHEAFGYYLIGEL
jgi:hypothetical protein